MAPKDKNNLVYYIFLYYGICALLPWNMILNSFDFFVIEVSSRFLNKFRCQTNLLPQLILLQSTLFCFAHKYGL